MATSQLLDSKLKKIQFLTGANLKVIAILIMLFDHFFKIILQWFLNNYWSSLYTTDSMTWEQFSKIDNYIRFNLYAVGTIAFPIFCFLVSEGFHYTHNRKKYVGMMLVFAIISELPFDLGFFSEYSRQVGTFPFYWNYQNVFFTLFLGLLSLVVMEKISSSFSENTDKIKSYLLQIITVIAVALIAELICCDYGKEGILFIVAFYISRKNRIFQILLFLITYICVTGNQPTFFILFSCILILLYNGKRGKVNHKYLFYIFYPLHILILYILTFLLPCFKI